MVPLLSRLRTSLPDRLLAAFGVATVFAALVVVDQMHWWRLKSDYAFGWLVPLFVVYVVVDRWPRLQELLRSRGPSPLPRWFRMLSSMFAGALLGVGMIFFLLGAIYRAGAGISQPGSLALALGFAGIALGLVFFNAPDGTAARHPVVRGWRVVRADARLQVTMLFLFPALIWILSAPLVSAVENTISLFLLQKVVTVVSTVFEILGYPLIREGNVLVLPQGEVGVADACSGIRSLTACLFAGSFLAAIFLNRMWKKIVLVVAAMGLAFFTNLLRSLFLTAWAYVYGSNAIGGTLHDVTGFAVLGLTCIGLFCLLPLFSGANWFRWLGGKTAAAGNGEPSPPAADAAIEK